MNIFPESVNLASERTAMTETEGSLYDAKWVEQVNADVNFLERLAGSATTGLYVPVDCRHLTAPAECVDYGVVSVDEGREVSRVWKEEDARFQAAANPTRILRLLSAYRQLQAENANLRSANTNECVS
jgi:hypothetical protein